MTRWQRDLRLTRGGRANHTGGSGPAPVPPTNTVAPAASSADGATYGAQLSSTSGTWTGDATITFAYLWVKASDNSALPGTNNAATYTPQSGDSATLANLAVKCRVTGSNAAGSAAVYSNSVTIPAPASAFGFVAAAAPTTYSGGYGSLVVPMAPCLNGDLRIIHFIDNAGGSIATLAGWTKLGPFSSGVINSTVFYRVKQAGDTDADTTWAGTDQNGAAICYAFGGSGLNATPLGTPGHAFNDDSAGGGVTPAAITTTVDGSHVIYLGGSFAGNRWSAAQTGYVVDDTNSATVINGSVQLSHIVKATAGAVAPGALTVTISTYSSVVSVELVHA